jgi:hypothetical protein
MTRADAGPPIVWAGDAAFPYIDARSGQALVLLHGIGSATASLQYQVETLSPRFRVRQDTACDRASGCEPICGGSIGGSARSGSIAAICSVIRGAR